MYTEELVQLSKKSNSYDEMERVRDNFNKLEGLFVYKTGLSEALQDTQDLKVLFGYNTFRFIQQLLFRSKILAKGSVDSINNKNPLSSIIVLRSHFETTGGIAYLFKRLVSYYNRNIDFERMENDLFRLSLGATTIDMEEVPRPINVMDLIDATDFIINRDLFKYPKGEKPLFRDKYEFLSDFSHPNFHGLSSGSEVIHERKEIIYLTEENVSEDVLNHHLDLAISLELFCYCYSEVLSLINKNEYMPIIYATKGDN